jgi:hypothetical protein
MPDSVKIRACLLKARGQKVRKSVRKGEDVGATLVVAHQLEVEMHLQNTSISNS